MLLLPLLLSIALYSSVDATTTTKTTSTTSSSTSTSTSTATTLLVRVAAAAVKTPTLHKLYKGSNFFRLADWNFFDTTVQADPTWGQVK